VINSRAVRTGGLVVQEIRDTHMNSPALAHKIRKARAAAPSELPLVRQCAAVALASAGIEGDLDAAISNLKNAHGSNWSLITALQLLSGRRGQFAAECAPKEERATLFLAHLIGKSASSSLGLGSVNAPTKADIDEWRKHATAFQDEID